MVLELLKQSLAPCGFDFTAIAMSSTEAEKALRGELYYAFVSDLVAARRRCKHACDRYNNAGEVSRRRLVELWAE